MGNVMAIDDLVQSSGWDRSFDYQDWQYFLTDATGPWLGPLEWTYDKVGNRLTETRNSVTDDYAYLQNAATSGNTSLLDEIDLAGGGGGTREYTFDAAGFLEMAELHPADQAFDFDAAGQLAEYGKYALIRTEYDGRRFVSQIADAPVTYSSDGVLRGLPGPGFVEQINIIYFAGRPILTWDQNLSLIPTPPAVLRFLTVDHLGTPIHAFDSTAATVWFGGFEPFGRDFQEGTSGEALDIGGLVLRLPGQWDHWVFRDATDVTRVYQNVHRWYEPGTGRYVSSDPVGLRGGLNRHLFALSSPLSHSDPLGLAVLICSRRAEGVLGLFGNHAYFWDDRDGLAPEKPRFCGKGPSEHEDGPEKDQCNEVAGSPGREDELMDCCRALSEKSRGGVDWSPVTNDCSTQLHQCQRWLLGVEHATEAPGGRIVPPCDRCEPESNGSQASW